MWTEKIIPITKDEIENHTVSQSAAYFFEFVAESGIGPESLDDFLEFAEDLENSLASLSHQAQQDPTRLGELMLYTQYSVNQAEEIYAAPKYEVSYRELHFYMMYHGLKAEEIMKINIKRHMVNEEDDDDDEASSQDPVIE